MKLSLKAFLSFLPALLLVGLSLASCGGSGGNSSTGTSSTTSGANMTLKVALVNKSLFFFPFYVAQQQGFIKNQGLTLDPADVPLLGSGSKLATAVEANSIEVGVGGLTDVFTISRIDAQIKVLGAMT